MRQSKHFVIPCHNIHGFGTKLINCQTTLLVSLKAPIKINSLPTVIHTKVYLFYCMFSFYLHLGGMCEEKIFCTEYTFQRSVLCVLSKPCKFGHFSQLPVNKLREFFQDWLPCVHVIVFVSIRHCSDNSACYCHVDTVLLINGQLPLVHIFLIRLYSFLNTCIWLPEPTKHH